MGHLVFTREADLRVRVLVLTLLLELPLGVARVEGAVFLLESMQLVVEELTELGFLVIFLIFDPAKLRVDIVLAVLDIILVLEVLLDELVILLHVRRVALCVPGNVLYELSLIRVHLLVTLLLDHLHVTSFVELNLGTLVGLSVDQVVFELIF